MRNCVTVDVEEWFHVCANDGPLAVDQWDTLPSRVVDTTRDMLQLFDACGVRATFFVLGWIAERYPALVQEIARAGHEIGSHGHRHQCVFELTPERFAQDLAASRAALAAAGVAAVRGYRAPLWSINDRSLWALDSLARAGFTFDSSMAPLKMIGNPDFPRQPHRRSTSCGDMLEFPPLVGRRFGQDMPLGFGWGLRMSSPARVLRAIDERNSRGIPVALAVHPWEIDPDPPRVTLPPGKHFAHYFRLGGFRRRLERVLRGASFAPMGDVLGLLPLSP
jgi:polysaccharide deacetylase family protein (PEP-CTERM system associated)